MEKVLFFILAVFAAFIFSCGSEDPVVGTWKPTQYSFAGEKKDNRFLENTTLVFQKNGTAAAKVNGMHQTGTYKVEGDTVTFTFKIGPNGIDVVYKIVGDTLKIDNPVTKAIYRKVK